MPTVISTVDAYVNEDASGANYGHDTKLQVSASSAHTRQAYYFVTKPFPAGSRILSAYLRVYLAANAVGTTTLTVRRVGEGWKEQRVTWDNRPNASDDELDTAAITGLLAGAQVEFDVKDMLQDVADGADFHGFKITSDTSGVNKLYSSDDPTSGYWATLEIEWAEAPEPPDSLVPDGGGAVGQTKPKLSWKFNDVTEGGTQLYSQVQIDNDETFASPVYDTGQVANVTDNWLTTVTGAVQDWAGIGSGNTRYWRVRTWDDSGLVSDWSDVAEMTYIAQGTLTLDNPPDIVGSYVEELTPPIAWTLVGATQELARVILEEINSKGLWQEIWKMPREVTDEASIHIPKDILHTKRKDGAQAVFRVTVDVWDDEDRLDNPSYTRVQRTFTYNRSGDPAAVATLTATVDGHFVILQWTRSTMPDYFSLRVDGNEEIQRIDPDDVFVSGTTYRMVYCRAKGSIAATYEIEAVVNDGTGKHEHSDGNPTATVTTDPFGIVLVDEDPWQTPKYIVMRGTDGPDFQIGETAETFRLVGMRRPVRVTDSIGGYEGTVTGTVLTNAEKDIFEELKGSGKRLRLMIADTNIPVVLGETSLQPQPEDKTRWELDFEVFQVGDFTFELGSGEE